MLACFTEKNSSKGIAISVIKQKNFDTWLEDQPSFVKTWLKSINFSASNNTYTLIPDENSKLKAVVLCIPDENNFFAAGILPQVLPIQDYFFEKTDLPIDELEIAWGLGAYKFQKYKKISVETPKLILSNKEKVNNIVSSIYTVRDLINTPTEDLGPSELSKFAKDFAKKFNAKFTEICGDDLLKQNFPMIHAVGRASDDDPRLIDICWGNEKHPKVTLVGKGVCFDTGGLDLKTSSGMILMKKDMGGAAHVLGLAQMIMSANLPISLRILIPAVENSVSGNSYRPGDVINSRKGLTVEIGNTDAEGRLVLADAITEASSENPDLIIDIATLTGAARVALGTELPAVFANNDAVVSDVTRSSTNCSDPVWHMPLFPLYKDSIKSQIADLNNVGADSYGGAITAALFLQEFLGENIPWLHYDLMAWNLKAKPGKPQGGEAMAIRGLFAYLNEKYAIN